MTKLLFGISKILVSYVYKWIFPIMATIFTVVFGDNNQNIFIRYGIWALICVAYISIPLNFENPKQEKFIFFFKNRFGKLLWILLQAIALGAGIFILTMIFIIYCFPKFNHYSYLVSTSNAILYSVTLLLEYSLLKRKISNFDNN